MSLERLIFNVDKLIEFDQIVYDIIVNSKDEIEELQRQQMQEGQEATGQLIQPDYTRTTAFIKERRPDYKAPPGIPNLLDTGDFQEDVLAKFTRKFIELTSTDQKTPDLIEKYGEDIFGLNEDFQELLINTVLIPKAQIKVKQMFGI